MFNKKLILTICMLGVLASSACTQAGFWNSVSSWYTQHVQKNKTALITSYIVTITVVGSWIFYKINQYFENEKITLDQNENQKRTLSRLKDSAFDNNQFLCNEDMTKVLKIESQLQKIKDIITQKDNARFIELQAQIAKEISSYEIFIGICKNKVYFKGYEPLLDRVLRKIIEIRQSIKDIEKSIAHASLQNNAASHTPMSAFGSMLLTPGTIPANTRESMYGSLSSLD